MPAQGEIMLRTLETGMGMVKVKIIKLALLVECTQRLRVLQSNEKKNISPFPPQRAPHINTIKHKFAVDLAKLIILQCSN